MRVDKGVVFVTMAVCMVSLRSRTTASFDEGRTRGYFTPRAPSFWGHFFLFSNTVVHTACCALEIRACGVGIGFDYILNTGAARAPLLR
jgi:hypothetical protein